jgi:hypothetical protein
MKQMDRRLSKLEAQRLPQRPVESLMLAEIKLAIDCLISDQEGVALSPEDQMFMDSIEYSNGPLSVTEAELLEHEASWEQDRTEWRARRAGG